MVSNKCELCSKKNGFQGFKCRTCKRCGLCVHETCYGLPKTIDGEPSSDWMCHACKAVGRTFVISKPGDKNVRTMKQEERPSDCALCPIVGGVHAMHPLYDKHGPFGRPVLLRADRRRNLPDRLAWVHSACAYGIGSSRLAGGCVFGCFDDGGYVGESSDEEESDDDDDDEDHAEKGEGGNDSSPRSKRARKDRGSAESTVHHFVICGKENGEDTDWTNVIRECRALKCYLCGNSCCPPTHIPLQCCANDKDEFHEHKPRHKDPGPCFEALHVGCARWGPHQAPHHRRHYFFPGASEGAFTDPVNEIYCDLHAREVYENKQQQQQQQPERTASASASAAAASSTATRPNLSSASSSRRPEPKKPESAWFKEIKDDVVKLIKRAQAKDGDVIEATKKAKEYWKNQRSAMGMTLREFNSVWKRVKEEITTMPEFSQDNDTSDAKSAANDESETNRWSSIWEPGGTYEFGDWDTYVEVSSDE